MHVSHGIFTRLAVFLGTTYVIIALQSHGDAAVKVPICLCFGANVAPCSTGTLVKHQPTLCTSLRDSLSMHLPP